jgi:long-chain acyl-CoA synthetase
MTDTLNGNVGVCLQCTEAKLRDIPELGYFARKGQGELLIRGSSVFQGYFKDEEKTTASFENGWFKTGDVFELTKTNQLRLLSRCKELVKLSQGEYVSLAKVQEVYSRTKYVSQIYVHAGMLSRYLVAIVVLNEKEDGWDRVDCKKMMELLDGKAREGRLNGFEKVRAVFLTREAFSTENGLMTPSLKLRSDWIAKRYEKELTDMLNSVNAVV